MNAPLCSVIVPIYNVEKYLPECVDSILNQTLTDLEVILVDDGSPDSCPAICDTYAAKDSRVKVIHKLNGGLSSARNAGLDIASGRYIGFVDSDDMIELDMYEKMVQRIVNSDADLCFCRVISTDEDGILRENNRLFGLDNSVLSGRDVLNQLVKGGSTYYESIWNKLYKRELFDSLRFIEGKQHEDAFIVHHIYGRCSRIVFLENLFYIYRLRSDSIMRKEFSVKRLDVIDAFMDRVNYCLARGLPETAGYAMVQLVGKTLESWMHIKRDDTDAQDRIRRQINRIRMLCRKVPMETLPIKEQAKVLLGLYATPLYRIKLRIQK